MITVENWCELWRLVFEEYKSEYKGLQGAIIPYPEEQFINEPILKIILCKSINISLTS